MGFIHHAPELRSSNTHYAPHNLYTFSSQLYQGNQGLLQESLTFFSTMVWCLFREVGDFGGGVPTNVTVNWMVSGTVNGRVNGRARSSIGPGDRKNLLDNSIGSPWACSILKVNQL